MTMSNLQPIRKQQRRKKEEQEVVEVITSTIESLKIIKGEDCLFPAALGFVCGQRPLFVGPSGGGKSVRQNALLINDNYQALLYGKLDKVQVEVIAVAIDMIAINTCSELFFERGIFEGSTFKSEVGIARFIKENGFKSRAQFEKAEMENRDVLKRKKGKIVIHTLVVDDFDRVQDIGLTNSFMKSLSDTKHVLFDNQEYFLRLNCIASSNSAVGRPKSAYLGARGIDAAVGNRFSMFHVAPADTKMILLKEFPDHEDAVSKITKFVDAVRKQQIEDGAFLSIGEISLRQIRPLLHQISNGFISTQEAAERLLAGISMESEERITAENIVAVHFSSGQGFGKKIGGSLW